MKTRTIAATLMAAAAVLTLSSALASTVTFTNNSNSKIQLCINSAGVMTAQCKGSEADPAYKLDKSGTPDNTITLDSSKIKNLGTSPIYTSCYDSGWSDSASYPAPHSAPVVISTGC